MPYKVTIEMIDRVARSTREWQKVADSGNTRDGGPQYEYVEVVKEQEVDRKVYEQYVHSIDLIAVIRAVNGMGLAP